GKAAHDEIDVASKRFGQQRMKCRSLRTLKMSGSFDHRMRARRAGDDAASYTGGLRLKDHAAAWSGDTIKPWLRNTNADRLGFRRQPEQAQARVGKISDE